MRVHKVRRDQQDLPVRRDQQDLPARRDQQDLLAHRDQQDLPALKANRVPKGDQGPRESSITTIERKQRTKRTEAASVGGLFHFKLVAMSAYGGGFNCAGQSRPTSLSSNRPSSISLLI